MNYDPLNRLTTMVDGVGTTLYGYLPSLKLRQAGDAIERGTALAKAPAAAEAMARQAAPWPNDTVNYTYANRLRASLSVQAPNGAPWSQNYGYDTARRLTGVASPAGTFGYAYQSAIFNLPSSVLLPGGAYITNTFDSVARETGTWLLNSAGSNLDSYVYSYNKGNQRTEVVRTAGDYGKGSVPPICTRKDVSRIMTLWVRQNGHGRGRR